MNDYNNGALPDPCLRLDYGFGEQWASVELGDGTGYVKLADYEKLESENAKLRAERDYLLINSNPTATELRRVRSAWKKDRDENAKLRELAQSACGSTAASRLGARTATRGTYRRRER